MATTVHDGYEQSTNYVKLELVVVLTPESVDPYYTIYIPENRSVHVNEMFALYEGLGEIMMEIENQLDVE